MLVPADQPAGRGHQSTGCRFVIRDLGKQNAQGVGLIEMRQPRAAVVIRKLDFRPSVRHNILLNRKVTPNLGFGQILDRAGEDDFTSIHHRHIIGQVTGELVILLDQQDRHVPTVG